ncbi:MAG: phosphatidate cytidylyltransferase [Chloroflexi bacterium]|nr:phosphatidate cytidylyltransferase [Chloroflexota bacterium]
MDQKPETRNQKPETTARGGLRQRLITVSILIPILVAVNWAGEPWFSLLVGLAAVYATYEFGQLARRASLQPSVPIAAALAVAFVVMLGRETPAPTAVAVLTGFAAAASLWILARREPRTAAVDWALTLALPLYTGLLLAHFVLLRRRPLGAEWVLFTMFVTWVTDAGAYFVGRSAGRLKLAPTISPRKTLEGAVGGVVVAVAAAVPLAWLLGLPFTTIQAVGIGTLVAVAAEVGDLVESAFKRSLQAEEAGQIFPGHGGLLDRMDSLVFAAVVMYYLS